MTSSATVDDIPTSLSRKMQARRPTAAAASWTASMRVGDRELRTIWLAEDGWSVNIIHQTRLPHHLAIWRLVDLEGACKAIRTMQVRGAPLIGAAAAYGLALALRDE